MKHGVWYGAAIWFVLLKLFDITPFSEWNWYYLIILITWPTISNSIEKQNIRNPSNIHNKQIGIRE